MKHNGDQKNDKCVTNRDTEGHADKHTVKEDPHFQEEDLHHGFFVLHPFLHTPVIVGAFNILFDGLCLLFSKDSRIFSRADACNAIIFFSHAIDGSTHARGASGKRS